MSRWLAVAVVGAMLAVPMASGTTYTQPGNGPERTGAIDFEGPATNDTAFEIQLPGVPIGQAVLVDNQAYIGTFDASRTGFDGETENLTEDAIWRIDLDTASKEKVMNFPEGKAPISSALLPSQLLVQDVEAGTLAAVEVPSGEEIWSVEAVPDDARDYRAYGGVARSGKTLYVGFRAFGSASQMPGPFGYFRAGPEDVTGVMAVDLGSGQEAWTWTRPKADRSRDAVVQGSNLDPEHARDAPDIIPCCWSLSADDEQVYLYTRMETQQTPGTSLEGEGAQAEYYQSHYEVRALRGGASLWTVNDTEQKEVDLETSRGGIEPMSATGWSCCSGFPVATDNAIYLRLDQFVALNPAQGAPPIWESEVGRSDRYDVQGTNAIGARGDVLIGTSQQTIYRLDTLTGAVDWQVTKSEGGILSDPIVLDPDTAYIPIAPPRENPYLTLGLEARDLETGEVKWRWTHYPTVGRPSWGSNTVTGVPAFGPGVMVWGAKDGTVTVIGETEASLGSPTVPSQQYPEPGNETTIEVSGAEPGAFGPVTRYMVDWGDGTVSGWQEGTRFTHIYNDTGTYDARVYAANDANQTSSSVVTMSVGEEPPAEPNLVETAFQRENQDMTFGVLGILVAVTGGAIGVARRKRKQATLQDELETLEHGFEDTKDNPGECEAFLETRKARARSLLMDGHLTEEQFGVIESRVDELGRKLRTSILDERFQFLPYGMVQSLKRMLADGQISAWERDTFETVLKEDDTLSRAQKEKVRDQLDRWMAEDNRGGAR